MDAVSLFQSSYLFREGLESLGKATGSLLRKDSPVRSKRENKIVEGIAGISPNGAFESAKFGQESADYGATRSKVKQAPYSSASFLGKRGREQNEGFDSVKVKRRQSTNLAGRAAPSKQIRSTPVSSRPFDKEQSPPPPRSGSTERCRSREGGSRGGVESASLTEGRKSRPSMGIPDVAAVLRRSVPIGWLNYARRVKRAIRENSHSPGFKSALYRERCILSTGKPTWFTLGERFFQYWILHK